MDAHPTHAERLPAIYRAILDGASELERRGMRAAAFEARRRAARAYTTWDAKAERRLQAILDDIWRETRGESVDGPRARLGLRIRLRGRTRSGSLVRPTA